jgi:hypothetical protein
MLSKAARLAEAAQLETLDDLMEESFICGTCGREHSGLPMDYAFGLPDEVFALGYLDRYRRSRSNSDFSTLDERRFFIRGVLPLPLVASEEEFVWGLWAEVSRDQHDLYFAGFHADLSDNPPFEAHLANEIPGYGCLGLRIDVQFLSGNDRPAFSLAHRDDHLLAREQHAGITRARHHEILEQVGFFA